MTTPLGAPARRLISLFLAALLAVAGALILPAPAHAAGPSVTTTPVYAGGGTVTVTGSDFTAASPGVYIGLGAAGASGFYTSGATDTVWAAPGNVEGDGAAGRTTPMTAEGTFTATLTVPPGADAGFAVYTSKAHGQGFSDPSQNTVTDVSVLPAPSVTAAPLSEDGGTLTVTGSGFLPDSRGAYVALADAGTTAIDRSNPTAQWLRAGAGLNPDGTFSTTFEVGPRLETGDLYVLTARGHLATDVDLSTRTAVSYTPSTAVPAPEPTSEPTPEPTPTDEPTAPAPTPEPTPEPTPAPSDKPTPAPSEKPAPTPSAPATASRVAGATLGWGVKSSFTDYLSSPVANGGWTLDGVTRSGGSFGWVNGSGNVETSTTTGLVTYPGTLRFTGHDGDLDLTFSNLAVQLRSTSEAVLRADVTDAGQAPGTRTDGPTVLTGIELATVDLSAAAVTADSIRVSGAPATLTSAGVAAFANFYPAGAALDPVSFVLPLDKPGSGTTPVIPDTNGAPPPTVSPGTGGNDTGAGTSPDKTPESAVPAAVQQTESKPRYATVCTSNAVQGATLDWGVKSSFRSYIRSAIANGGWTVNGVADTGSGFSFGSGTGSYASDSRTGAVSYPGSISFQGHGDTLKLTLSGISIRQTGSGTGVLIATVESSDMDGNRSVHSGVPFAALDLSGVSVGAGAVSVAGAPATLTAEGAAAFAGFYEAGAALDPVSFTFPLGDATDCSSVLVDENGNPVGSLASTGLGGTSVLVGAAALALLLGAGLTLAARRGRAAHV
ncbi:HtaA domain-containing protein [Arthrobacter sp. NPDC097144]|uniref:HtaA domain-containing protein n=1 Tax=Arthrobacter sp. NPDC097144 TaxID=3363946 RepID=UPI00380601F5